MLTAEQFTAAIKKSCLRAYEETSYVHTCRHTYMHAYVDTHLLDKIRWSGLDNRLKTKDLCDLTSARNNWLIECFRIYFKIAFLVY